MYCEIELTTLKSDFPNRSSERCAKQLLNIWFQTQFVLGAFEHSVLRAVYGKWKMWCFTLQYNPIIHNTECSNTPEIKHKTSLAWGHPTNFSMWSGDIQYSKLCNLAIFFC